MKRIGRRQLLWLALFGVDCLIVAATGELWIRAFVPVRNICYTVDETLGVHHCPNQRRVGYVEDGYWNILITNSLGFHDVERRVEKEAGVYRIQIYGDSLILGLGVKREETLPAVVERRLNESSIRMRFEVANMAAMDSTTSQLLTWEKFGRRFKPDMVVSSFADDFPDNLAVVHQRPHQTHHRLDENGELVLVPGLLKDLDRPWERFKRFSRLYRLTANKYKTSRVYRRLGTSWRNLKVRRAAASDGDASGDRWATRRRLLIEQGWPLTLQLLEEFRDRVEADGSRFVLLDSFKLRDVNVGTVYANSDLEEFAARRAITYVATWQVLKDMETSETSDRLFLRDKHPTPEGNEILGAHIAERLLDVMQKQGLLTAAERKQWKD